MGKPTGFLEIPRQERGYAPVGERIRHFQEFVIPLPENEIRRQGARCMDCGIPFCHEGCPINNIIPDWNDLVYHGHWREALEVLHSTNNFPEFTGRVCPAPCETACTLNLSDAPVTIKTIECAIIDKGWQMGWVQPQIPAHRTGKRVAIVGSGPAGLACAQQLARAGHSVVVYEKQPRIGGLLAYGIPDFKLSNQLIDRRIAQMLAEGVEFRPNSHVGANVPTQKLLDEFDALVLACGAEQPRDLSIPGRDLFGIHFAMDYLIQQNQRDEGRTIPKADEIHARDKDVVVIGGGDTGSDCIGTAVRQGARSVMQLEIMPKPPAQEVKLLTWPRWPMKLRTSTSHQEGCDRDWEVGTKAFLGENGWVTAVQSIRMQWRQQPDGRQFVEEVPGSEFTIKAELVLLAMGFTQPVHEGLLKELGTAFDERGNVRANTANYQTSLNRVFAAGDVRSGQSLVVWAIREGRQCARAVDEYLLGQSELPR
jgi:glutamate synthase (NADPH/NADH) small chain